MTSESAKTCQENNDAPYDSVLIRLKIASILCLLFLLVEVIGGLISGSLAVLSDAAHLFADLTAFIVAIAARHLANLPPCARYTYGLRRAEALAALFSMISLFLVSVWLAWEASQRLWPFLFDGEKDIVKVDGKLMSVVAFIGVVVNVALAIVLGEDHVHLPGSGDCHDHGGEHNHSHSHSHDHGGSIEEARPFVDCNSHSNDDGYGGTRSLKKPRNILHLDEITPDSDSDSNDVNHYDSHDHSHEHSHNHQDNHQHAKTSQERNVNLQAAYLHVLGDLAQSAAVLIAGLIIYFKPTFQIVDPILTICTSIFVMYSTIDTIHSSTSVLLEAVPPKVDYHKLRKAVARLEGVHDVHELHIWSMSHGDPALSLHALAIDVEKALKDVAMVCQKDFNIGHCTLQIQQIKDTDVGRDGVCITCAYSSKNFQSQIHP